MDDSCPKDRPCGQFDFRAQVHGLPSFRIYRGYGIMDSS